MIYGEKMAEKILEELEETESEPRLEIILVGENEASETFIEEKMEAAERIGFKASLQRYGEDVSEEKILQEIEKLNEDEEVDGILVQLPLPDHIDEDRVFETLDPEKDVDGLTPENIGKTLRGNAFTVPGAVKAVEKILENRVDFEGLEVTVINNSNLIGRPLAMRLTDKGATVTLCNEYTRDLEEHTRESDVVVTATGIRGLLTPEMVKKDSIVIDAGYSLGKGDVEDKEAMENKTIFCGVPGGVGPLTVAYIMENLLKCYRE